MKGVEKRCKVLVGDRRYWNTASILNKHRKFVNQFTPRWSSPVPACCKSGVISVTHSSVFYCLGSGSRGE
ncbi:hypothetical protein E2C01_041343 [Portunus trituberculatus]|uniref:Uncharacterized protein n=1 Tax=Portunus trituberculatus TaxID=210409 RepID=A0A5B7FMC5_PORTR|nr:hypothetical protein [Portunus trituberculatus]